MAQFVFPIILLVVLIYYNKQENYKEYSFLLIFYVFVIFFTEIGRLIILGGRGGFGGSSAVTSGLMSVLDFWYSSIFSFRFLYGGYMGNVVLFSLGIFGFAVYKSDGIFKKYLSMFVIVSSIVFLFTDEIIKSRLLYNIPLSVFASIIVCYFSLNEKNEYFSYFVFTYSLFYLFMALFNLI
jgi:hypothetical protein